MSLHTVTVTVNGIAHTTAVEPRTLLSDLLRHQLRLTGTHVGCEEGVCGACTVLLDGEPVRSCLLLAIQLDGRSIETVEGLADTDGMSQLQAAMISQHGLQCGFCTSGILMSLTAAERAGLPCEQATDQVLAGHVCRCTGYQGIRAAVNHRWEQLEANR